VFFANIPEPGVSVPKAVAKIGHGKYGCRADCPMNFRRISGELYAVDFIGLSVRDNCKSSSALISRTEKTSSLDKADQFSSIGLNQKNKRYSARLTGRADTAIGVNARVETTQQNSPPRAKYSHLLSGESWPTVPSSLATDCAAPPMAAATKMWATARFPAQCFRGTDAARSHVIRGIDQTVFPVKLGHCATSGITLRAEGHDIAETEKLADATNKTNFPAWFPFHRNCCHRRMTNAVDGIRFYVT
jgi:hypothetical protein